MERRLFGTDGIRGTANREPMTAEIALRVAKATAAQFRRGDHRHRVLIGKDTRLSGYMLEPALTAGFISMGMDVMLLGPMPTPAVAMLTPSLRADLGVVISASHNPYEDNGIKLFGPDGFKLCDQVESEIEARLADDYVFDLAAPAELGKANRLEDAIGRYTEFVKSSFPRRLRLDGLKLVVDCAHGAAYRVAPQVLFELGAEVIAIGVNPDGFNINRECGATDVRALKDRVVSEGADLGLALDGDADRLVMVDEAGREIDGDQLMALIATSWSASGRLRGGGVVATVMSNLGFERYLTELGLGMVRTPVGDRYVVERMRAEGYNVGGEQSGHIILSDYSTTGDGLIAALQVLALVQERDQPISTVAHVFNRMPQRLKSVRYAPLSQGRTPLDLEPVRAAVRAAEADLAQSGRLVIRKSGTEPVVRIMAEADDPGQIDRVVESLAETIASVGADRDASGASSGRLPRATEAAA